MTTQSIQEIAIWQPQLTEVEALEEEIKGLTHLIEAREKQNQSVLAQYDEHTKELNRIISILIEDFEITQNAEFDDGESFDEDDSDCEENTDDDEAQWHPRDSSKEQELAKGLTAKKKKHASRLMRKIMLLIHPDKTPFVELHSFIDEAKELYAEHNIFKLRKLLAQVELYSRYLKSQESGNISLITRYLKAESEKKTLLEKYQMVTEEYESISKPYYTDPDQAKAIYWDMKIEDLESAVSRLEEVFALTDYHIQEIRKVYPMFKTRKERREQSLSSYLDEIKDRYL